MTVARALVGLLLCALLAACSMTRTLYRHADWLLVDEVDEYVDLELEQRRRLAEALAVRLERHRREELPGFAAALEEAARRARDGLAVDDARWLLDTGAVLIRHSVDGTIPAIATVLADLDAEQRRHLAQQLRERNEAQRRRRLLNADRARRLRRRAERSVELIEDWTGPLRSEQVALITELRNRMPDSAPEWHAYRKAKQASLLALLAQGASARRVEAFLRAWWLELADMPPRLRQQRDAQIAAFVDLAARLDATLDAAQRARLVKRLQALAEDARALAPSA